MPSACYVYAILARETPLPTSVVGFGGAALTAIQCGELAAVTSDVDQTALRPTPERAVRHEAVIEALRQCGRVLPVRFGTAFANQCAAQRALAGRYAVLLADLTRLGDKTEFGLTVLWSAPNPGDREAATLDTDKPLNGTVMGAGTRYLIERLAEHRQAAHVQCMAKAPAKAIDDALKGQAIESRITVLATPRLLLRGSYLVEPSVVSAFREAFEGVRGAYPNFRFHLSGPWPPYSFVTPHEAAIQPRDLVLDLIADSSCVRGSFFRVAQQFPERGAQDEEQANE